MQQFRNITFPRDRCLHPSRTTPTVIDSSQCVPSVTSSHPQHPSTSQTFTDLQYQFKTNIRCWNVTRTSAMSFRELRHGYGVAVINYVQRHLLCPCRTTRDELRLSSTMNTRISRPIIRYAVSSARQDSVVGTLTVLRDRRPVFRNSTGEIGFSVLRTGHIVSLCVLL